MTMANSTNGHDERGPLDDDLVSPELGCPECGERRVDELIVDEDTESITCVSCGHVFGIDDWAKD